MTVVSGPTLEITSLSARRVLDEPGRAAVDVRIEAGTVHARALVPACAPSAVETIERRLAPELVGRRWASLEELDAVLCNLDGTRAKEHLGADATIGVSVAAARAFAVQGGQPLYRWLPHPSPERLPVPYFSAVRGSPAANRLDVRELMVVPIGAPSTRAAAQAGSEIHAGLRRAIAACGLGTDHAAQGGFVPALQAPEDVLDLLCQAIATSGYVAGTEVGIALDIGASRLVGPEGEYRLNGFRFSAADFVEYLGALVERFPITSIEDGMADTDPKGWELLTRRLGSRVQVVGGGSYAAPSLEIVAAAAWGRGTAAAIDPCRIGTVTEAISAIRSAYEEGFGAMVSHCAGTPLDPFTADLSVAVGCGQIKVGAPPTGQRALVADRLLAIAEEAIAVPFGVRRR